MVDMQCNRSKRPTSKAEGRIEIDLPDSDRAAALGSVWNHLFDKKASTCINMLMPNSTCASGPNTEIKRNSSIQSILLLLQQPRSVQGWRFFFWQADWGVHQRRHQPPPPPPATPPPHATTTPHTTRHTPVVSSDPDVYLASV